MQIGLIKRFSSCKARSVWTFRVLDGGFFENERRRKETDGRYRRRGPFWPWMRRRRAPDKCIRRHRRSDRWKRYATSRCWNAGTCLILAATNEAGNRIAIRTNTHKTNTISLVLYLKLRTSLAKWQLSTIFWMALPVRVDTRWWTRSDNRQMDSPDNNPHRIRQFCWSSTGWKPYLC